MTAADRAAGYTHRLALQQVEVSLTQVFASPVQGRHFFEAVIRRRPLRTGVLGVRGDVGLLNADIRRSPSRTPGRHDASKTG
jgi:hypothetical protein